MAGFTFAFAGAAVRAPGEHFVAILDSARDHRPTRCTTKLVAGIAVVGLLKLSVLAQVTMPSTPKSDKGQPDQPTAKISRPVDLPAFEGSYALQGDGYTVAIMPANKLEIIGDSAGQNGANITMHTTKITVTIPGQSPTTISGDELTLVPQK